MMNNYPLTTHWLTIPRIKNFHCNEKNRCTLHPEQSFMKILMNSDQNAMNLMVIMRLYLITYQTHILRKTPQHTSLGGGMVLILEK